MNIVELALVFGLIGCVVGSLITAAAFTTWLLWPKKKPSSGDYFIYRPEPMPYVANWDQVVASRRVH